MSVQPKTTRVQASREPQRGKGVEIAIVIGVLAAIIGVAVHKTTKPPVREGLTDGDRSLAGSVKLIYDDLAPKINVVADEALRASQATGFAPARFAVTWVAPLQRDLVKLREGAAEIRKRAASRPQDASGRTVMSDVPTEKQLDAWEAALGQLAALLAAWTSTPDARAQMSALRQRWQSLITS